MNEQAKVGFVVVVSAVLLTAAAFAIANLHFGAMTPYKSYFKFAGGLEVGAPVRFAGLKVGRVTSVAVDSQDPTRVVVSIEVTGGTPIGTDSQAAVTQLTMLSENYVEVTPGRDTKPLPANSVITSNETQGLNALIAKMSGLADSAQPLIVDLHKNLNQISDRADKLLANLQEVTGEKNQKNLAGVLSESNAMLAENRPKIAAITDNFQTASAQLAPLMADLKETNLKVQKLIDNANGMVDEDRDKIKADLDAMGTLLKTTTTTIEQLRSMLTANSDNLDLMLDNFRQTSENFRMFSDTLKHQPSSLIFKDTRPDRTPPVGGAAEKPSKASKKEKRQ